MSLTLSIGSVQGRRFWSNLGPNQSKNSRNVSTNENLGIFIGNRTSIHFHYIISRPFTCNKSGPDMSLNSRKNNVGEQYSTNNSSVAELDTQMISLDLKPSMSILKVGGHVTEILSIEAQQPEFHILLIPGNPGVVPFYSDYLADLWKFLDGKSTVTAISHVAHTRKNWENGKLFSLADQISHKVNYIKQETERQPHVPWVLIGHSIGAYIAKEAFKELEPSYNIHHIIALYPFIALNETSTWQKILSTAAHSWILGVVLSSIAAVLGRLPRLLTGGLMRRTLASMWSPGAEVVLCDYMLQYSVTRNYGFMGMTEFDTLNIEGDLEFLKDHAGSFSFLFGEDDHWGPLHLKEKIENEIPRMRVCVEQEGHDHTFCCSIEGSRWVAKYCADLIQSLHK